MKTLKIYLGAIIGIGFLIFIAVRLIKTNNYKRKALYIFLVILGIDILIGVSILYDYLKNSLLPNYSLIEPEYIFANVGILLLLIIPTIYFVIGHNRKQKFKNFDHYKKKMEAKNAKAIEVKEYIYVCYIYQSKYYLKKILGENKDSYSAPMYRFPKTVFFKEDMVNKIINKFNLNLESTKYIGIARKQGKKETKYYCYKFILNELPEFLNVYDPIPIEQLYNYELNSFNKEIVFRMIIGQEFDIEV